MKQMTLRNIAAACGGTYIGPEETKDREIQGAVIDSRQVQQDYLYIAMRGERVDGHKFIPDVYGKGALAAVSEDRLEDPKGPYILVASCPQALKDIAEYYRSTLTIPIVGIAGSVGKTSTKEMIAGVLAQRFCVLKTEGNFNNEIGLPLTLMRIREEHEIAVVEMGISDFGEMHRLAKMARPDICVMTNIGQAHLENLIDRDGILRAKSEMFDFLTEKGTIVLNGNDDKLSTIGRVHGVTPLRYYVETEDKASADVAYTVVATDVQNRGLRGMAAKLIFEDETCNITEPLQGAHHVYNACAAACVGMTVGMTKEEICRGIAAAKTIAGRSNVIDLGEVLVIDDCYNANPVSMKASLDILAKADGRKIAVLGDMGELGADEIALHSEVGAYAAEQEIDLVFCAGQLSAHLAEAARAACDVRYYETVDEMIPALLGEICSGDNIIVKASHFMNFPKIVEAIRKEFAGQKAE